MATLYTITTDNDYRPRFILNTENLAELSIGEKTHIFEYIWVGGLTGGRVYVAEFDSESGFQTYADEFDGVFTLPEEARCWYGAYREQAFVKNNGKGSATCWQKFQAEIDKWIIEGK